MALLGDRRCDAPIAWLDRVVADLERFRHPSGGYAEWDTGYTAACARNENGECALLANNGDPVAEIASGRAMGLLRDDLVRFYR